MSCAKRLKKGDRDLEIVCNLLWKNKYGYENDMSSNIVGMYDIPSTTLDWDTFKAYLVKNSGNSSADVKVTFVDTNDKEIPIQSQNDFQLALYSFRKKARNNEIITLKMEKIENRKKNKCVEVTEEDCLDSFIVPPLWFSKYMKKFKKDIIDEITSTMITTVSKNSHQHTSHHRKSKVDMYKRSRKYSDEYLARFRCSEDHINKLEMKIENKLEKLESKNHRIKAKSKTMKLSSDSDPGLCPVKSRFIGMCLDNNDNAMNATAVNSYQTTAPRMLGGERYLQKWEVINTGTQPWTSNTELRFAWGSELLKPAEKKVSCPQLQPGEKGEVFVCLDVPNIPGNYESYWHFYHFGRRFGHWLGCQLIVDESPLRKSYTPPGLPTSSVLKEECKNNSSNEPTGVCEDKATNDILETTIDSLEETNYSFPNLFTYLNQDMEKLNISSNHLTGLKESNEGQISSDSDNLSIISMSGGNSISSDLFEFIGADDKVQNKEDNEQNENKDSHPNETEIAKVEISDSDESLFEKLDNANINLAMHLIKTETDKQTELNSFPDLASSSENPEYAYIHYNGEKYAFHKKYLNEEYFKTAEKAKTQSNESSSSANERSRNNSQNSENRLFVFPRHSPGFEVVYPTENGEAETLTSMAVCVDSIPDTFTSLSSSPCESNFQPQFERFHSLESEKYEERLDSANPNPLESDHPEVKRCSPIHCSYPPPSNDNSEANSEVKSDSGSTNSNRQEKTNVRPQKPHVNSPQDNLLTGAAILASSAMSTARNMMSLVMQTGEGHWVNGHWVSESSNSKRENGLRLLAEMGFYNRDLNATLLARYNDDIQLVISELIQ